MIDQRDDPWERVKWALHDYEADSVSRCAEDLRVGITTRLASGAPIPAPANLFALLPLDVLVDKEFIGAGAKAESQPISGPQP